MNTLLYSDRELRDTNDKW
jgi:hypothetical protein